MASELIAFTAQEQSFSARVQVGADSNCWYWHGPTRNGHPLFYDSAKRKQVYAKRWAYENWIDSIPLHARLRNLGQKCLGGSKQCVNPYHYELQYTESNTQELKNSLAVETGTISPAALLSDAAKRFAELEKAEPLLTVPLS